MRWLKKKNSVMDLLSAPLLRDGAALNSTAYLSLDIRSGWCIKNFLYGLLFHILFIGNGNDLTLVVPLVHTSNLIVICSLRYLVKPMCLRMAPTPSISNLIRLIFPSASWSLTTIYRGRCQKVWHSTPAYYYAGYCLTSAAGIIDTPANLVLILGLSDTL